MKYYNELALKAVVSIFSLLVVIATAVFGFLSNTPTSIGDRNATTNFRPGTLFISDAEERGLKYPTEVDPASWVFVIIWPIIFLWNIIAHSYIVASICLKTDNSPIKRDPPLVSYGFLVLSILSWGLCMSWLFVFDRDQIIVGLVVLILAALTSYGMLAMLYIATAKDTLILEEYHRGVLILTRVLIHNGVAVYATWISFAWVLNLQTVISYDTLGSVNLDVAEKWGSLTLEDEGTIYLAIIMFKLIVWFVLENFVIERFCRYTLTIYPVCIFVFAGVFVRLGNNRNNFYPDTRNQILCLVALCLAVLMFIIRIPLVIYRHRHRPHY